jgi:hypothetical protein
MERWPALTAEQDHDTLTILHLAAQMLGKVRVAHAPWVNHGWHVALQPDAAGLVTLPTAASGGRSFTLALDLCRHVIAIRTSDGAQADVALAASSIAELHRGLVEALERCGLPSTFNGRPSEIPDAPPFADDHAVWRYSTDSAARFRQAIAAMLPVFAHHRAAFAGKASPVHFWWGAFDLSVSVFSGKPAPEHPGNVPGLPDRIAREAYSHEVASSGFWGGGATAAEPFFYAYLYPEPPGYRTAAVAHGRFDEGFGEWVLPYAQVAASPDPARMLGEFFASAHAAGADQAGWDRPALERAVAAP